MGWNDVSANDESGLFAGLATGARFYFLHSYYLFAARPEQVLAVTEYGGAFAASVHAGNVYGVQFHPEKSHHWGVRLLKNFAEL
jgi:glutamine amidotransferase